MTVSWPIHKSIHKTASELWSLAPYRGTVLRVARLALTLTKWMITE